MSKTITVLVVEDTPASSKLVTMLLEMAGYAVLQADNAVDGIVLAKEQLPDLILMDIQLSGMDGLTAIRALKQDERTSGIAIAALTAHAMDGDERRMKDSGCDGYIAKPIRYQSFLEEVNRLLALRERDRG
jgi:two-component system cell cycle response regulator DivK